MALAYREYVYNRQICPERTDGTPIALGERRAADRGDRVLASTARAVRPPWRSIMSDSGSAPLNFRNWHEAEVLRGRVCGPLAEGERTSRGHGKTSAIDPSRTPCRIKSEAPVAAIF
jgi:hypothetical protein